MFCEVFLEVMYSGKYIVNKCGMSAVTSTLFFFSFFEFLGVVSSCLSNNNENYDMFFDKVIG